MHSDKGEEAEYCPLPSEETNQDMCLDETYSTSQLGNSLTTTQGRPPSTPEAFESARQLEEMDPNSNEPQDPVATSERCAVNEDEEILKPYACQQCGKLYSEMRSLQRHIKISHRSEELSENHTLQNSEHGAAPFQCQQCDRQFRVRSHYHYHVKIYHGPRGFKCQICDKAFVSRGALTTHGRIHSGEKPYACETCGRRFNVNSNLLAHIPKCTGALPFKCDLCEKAFATKSLYQTHVKVQL